MYIEGKINITRNQQRDQAYISLVQSQTSLSTPSHKLKKTDQFLALTISEVHRKFLYDTLKRHLDNIIITLRISSVCNIISHYFHNEVIKKIRNCLKIDRFFPINTSSVTEISTQQARRKNKTKKIHQFAKSYAATVKTKACD